MIESRVPTLQLSDEFRGAAARPDVGNAQLQKLIECVSVFVGRCFIYVQQAQACAVIDVRRKRVPVEHQPEALIGLPGAGSLIPQFRNGSFQFFSVEPFTAPTYNCKSDSTPKNDRAHQQVGPQQSVRLPGAGVTFNALRGVVRPDQGPCNDRCRGYRPFAVEKRCVLWLGRSFRTIRAGLRHPTHPPSSKLGPTPIRKLPRLARPGTYRLLQISTVREVLSCSRLHISGADI